MSRPTPSFYNLAWRWHFYAGLFVAPFMILLALTGVPASIDGVFITTPAGLFEVAEACSGVKFLIAMIAFGTLVANVCFTSWPRRCVFIAASVIVPISTAFPHRGGSTTTR